MAPAMLTPDAQHGGDRKSEKARSSFSGKLEDVSAPMLSKARYLLRHDEEMLPMVGVADGAAPREHPCGSPISTAVALVLNRLGRRPELIICINLEPDGVPVDSHYRGGRTVRQRVQGLRDSVYRLIVDDD